ncbi:MAG: hypothetical protein K2I03_14100, partial [Lachnospiraceae bacterium]|nr:hypothetical protein [Lachnospiraceae bacterium]
MKIRHKKTVLQVLILCCFIAFDCSSAVAKDQTGTTEISTKTAEKNGWVNESDGKKYYINGECVKGIVKKIDGEYYGFDSRG